MTELLLKRTLNCQSSNMALSNLGFNKVLWMCYKLHGPSMLAVKAKIYGVLYKQSSSIDFDETSSN